LTPDSSAEAQRNRDITLGFPRTKSGVNPTHVNRIQQGSVQGKTVETLYIPAEYPKYRALRCVEFQAHESMAWKLLC
jgi:hypothetical protein